MRSIAIVSGFLSAAFLALCPFALAQQPAAEVPEANPGPGWKTCPRCQNDAHVAADREKYKVAGHPFDPHDISGVWGNNGIPLDQTQVSFTPYGQKLYEATKSDIGPNGVYIANSKDPRMICDPVGWPRQFASNYGFEFAQLPGRTFEFFEWGHTWRTIWTDGRKLPADPPYQRFEGYAVGRWEGDTFVVESSGFDDRSWITQRSAARTNAADYGFPHTAEMKVVERYRRLDYGTLEASITITDPKVFTKPWTTTGKETLRPGTEIGEYFCVPSESLAFDDEQTSRSAGATTSPFIKH